MAVSGWRCLDGPGIVKGLEIPVGEAIQVVVAITAYITAGDLSRVVHLPGLGETGAGIINRGEHPTAQQEAVLLFTLTDIMTDDVAIDIYAAGTGDRSSGKVN